MSWIDCILNDDYEIFTLFPHDIRKKSNHKPITRTRNSDGYVFVSLSGNTFGEHFVIASQFIQNPENLTEINHLNKHRDDNHIENLEWISHSDNLADREPYRKQESEFLAELPEHVLHINEYNNIEYNRYYYDIDNERIISTFKSNINNHNYKVIKPSKPNTTGAIICIQDINGIYHSLGYNKLINTMRNLVNETENVEQ